jgi:hypothetical protein
MNPGQVVYARDGRCPKRRGSSWDAAGVVVVLTFAQWRRIVARQKGPGCERRWFPRAERIVAVFVWACVVIVSRASATVLLLSALAVVPAAEARILASIGVVLPAQRIRDWPKRT